MKQKLPPVSRANLSFCKARKIRLRMFTGLLVVQKTYWIDFYSEAGFVAGERGCRTL